MAKFVDQQCGSDYTPDTVDAFLGDSPDKLSMYHGMSQDERECKYLVVLSNIVRSICRCRPENPDHYVKKYILKMKAQLTQGYQSAYEPIAKAPDDIKFIKKVLALHPVFGSLNDTKMQNIVEGLAAETYAEGTTIIKAGDRCRKFFIIVSGRVEMWCDGLITCATGKGSTFGELSLLYDKRYNQTVVARHNTHVWELDTEIYRMIILADLKEPIPAYLYENLPTALKKKVFNNGCAVIKKNENVDSFYIIESGVARVTEQTTHRVDESDNEEDGTKFRLQPRDFFGEVSLIYNCPSGLEVVAEGKLVCYVLNKDEFIRFLAKWYF